MLGIGVRGRGRGRVRGRGRGRGRVTSVPRDCSKLKCTHESKVW